MLDNFFHHVDDYDDKLWSLRFAFIFVTVDGVASLFGSMCCFDAATKLLCESYFYPIFFLRVWSLLFTLATHTLNNVAKQSWTQPLNLVHWCANWTFGQRKQTKKQLQTMERIYFSSLTHTLSFSSSLYS